jgi:hypothetical protein
MVPTVKEDSASARNMTVIKWLLLPRLQCSYSVYMRDLLILVIDRFALPCPDPKNQKLVRPVLSILAEVKA